MIRSSSIPPSKSDSSRKAVSFLLLVSFFVLLLRLPYTVVPFWTIDEAGYAAVANKLSDGQVLYKEACDNKPPFIFFFYAAVFFLFGQGNMWAVHVASLLFVFLGFWFLHRLSAQLFLEKTARVSTITYALYLVAAPAEDVFAANTEIYMVPAVIVGIYFCLAGLRIKSTWCWLAAGGFLGMASWIKQPAILFCLAVPIVAAMDAYPFEQTSLYNGFRRCVWAFVGFCSISLFWLAILWKEGILREFIDMVILYNTRVQTVSIPVWQSVRMAVHTSYVLFAAHFAAIVLALIGLGLLIGRLTLNKTPDENKHAADARHRTAIVLLSWLALSIVAVSLGGRFYGYYMYLLAPIIAVLAAVAFEHFQRHWLSFAPLTRLSLIVFVIIGCVVPLYSFQGRYFEQAVNATRNIAHKSDTDVAGLTSTPALMVSRYVAENTASGDQIFVWGYQPQIYVLSGRHFATRYFSVALQTGFVWGTIQQVSGWGYLNPDFQSMYPGLGSFTFKPSDTAHWIYPGSQELLMQDLQSNPPELFIDGNVPGEWPFGAKYPITSFPMFQEFLSKNYRLENTILGYRVHRRLKVQLHASEIVIASNQVPWL